MSDNPRPIQLWDIERLVPYEANAKKHSDEQIANLAKLIEKFSWTQPIVVWTNGEIIAGHGRRLAALKLGLKKVPVVVRDDLSKAEADALRLADNRVTSTEYDMSMISIELSRLAEELEGSSIDITDLGFDAKELEFTLSDLSAINEDFFVEDVGEAVEQQKAENESKVEETDDIAAPIADALGFKRVSIAESREIRSLFGLLESFSGKSGAAALKHALMVATSQYATNA